MFGPFEHQVSEAYRSIYIDIGGFADLILRWTPHAANILEVGCGEGAVTGRLRSKYPAADITAIDIIPHVGRLYRGPRDHVKFIQCTAQEIAVRERGRYDLIVLSDVMHHVPIELRQAILDAVRAALAPGGSLVFKDWQRNLSPIHWMCYASDRWITGDRINYMSRDEMRRDLSGSFGESALIDEARVGPWWNNLATLVRP
jgi:2-polyprenyl-6-hydroxyphenyl methylase/3-demethylubiquinone-9 3-methyltransferase